MILLIFAWKNIPAVKKVDCEKKVCVKLCHILHEEPIAKPIIKPKPIVKPKPKPKPKPKKIKPKPKKIKPKPVVKKVEIVKKEPVVIPKIEEVLIEEIQEDIVVESKEFTEPVAEEVYTESSESKQVRLEQDYLQEHIAKITKLLQENLYYPRRARKRGIVGEVMVKFKLSTDATAHSIEVLSSKSEILSRAAIKTIENLSGEFPKPNEELTLHVPINYSLK